MSESGGRLGHQPERFWTCWRPIRTTLSIRDLWVYVGYLERNGLDAQSYRLALWRKVAGSADLSGDVGDRHAVRVRPAALGRAPASGYWWACCSVWHSFMMNYLLGNVVLLYGYPPLVGAILPSLLFLAAGFLALHRLR
ncbi:MAG: hypothetical protein V9H25_08850 [Candidatus Competibacter sp.]